LKKKKNYSTNEEKVNTEFVNESSF